MALIYYVTQVQFEFGAIRPRLDTDPVLHA